MKRLRYRPCTNCLASICIDEMGREAVREGLKQVRLRHVAPPEQRHIAFAAGVLLWPNGAKAQQARTWHGWVSRTKGSR